MFNNAKYASERIVKLGRYFIILILQIKVTTERNIDNNIKVRSKGNRCGIIIERLLQKFWQSRRYVRLWT